MTAETGVVFGLDFCTIHIRALVRDREGQTLSSVANIAAKPCQPKFIFFHLFDANSGDVIVF